MPGHYLFHGILLLELRGILLDDGTNDGIIYTNAGVKICRHDESASRALTMGGINHLSTTLCITVTTRLEQSQKPMWKNIGLVMSEYPFSNQFLDVQAKGFLHFSLTPFGQFVVIDSAYTSRQRMRLFGLPTGKKRPPAITMAHLLNSPSINGYSPPNQP